MTLTPDRPALDNLNADSESVVADLIAHLQRGLDTSDADTYDARFADDILWGTPKGELQQGFRGLNEIHHRLMAAHVAPPSTFVELKTVAPHPDVIVSHIARRADDGGFSEVAMYVLVRHGSHWWVAAAQNTPVISELPGS